MNKYLYPMLGLALVAGIGVNGRCDMNGDQPEVSAAKLPVASAPMMDSNGVPKLDVEFQPAMAIIPASFNTGLNAFGNYLKNNPNSKAELRGYADHTGHGPANVALAQKRADMVSKYLQDHYGITTDRIASQGAGEVSDKVSNETAANQQFDRSVIGTIVTAKS